MGEPPSLDGAVNASDSWPDPDRVTASNVGADATLSAVAGNVLDAAPMRPLVARIWKSYVVPSVKLPPDEGAVTVTGDVVSAGDREAQDAPASLLYW